MHAYSQRSFHRGIAGGVRAQRSPAKSRTPGVRMAPVTAKGHPADATLSHYREDPLVLRALAPTWTSTTRGAGSCIMTGDDYSGYEQPPDQTPRRAMPLRLARSPSGLYKQVLCALSRLCRISIVPEATATACYPEGNPAGLLSERARRGGEDHAGRRTCGPSHAGSGSTAACSSATHAPPALTHLRARR